MENLMNARKDLNCRALILSRFKYQFFNRFNLFL